MQLEQESEDIDKELIEAEKENECLDDQIENAKFEKSMLQDQHVIFLESKSGVFSSNRAVSSQFSLNQCLLTLFLVKNEEGDYLQYGAEQKNESELPQALRRWDWTQTD